MKIAIGGCAYRSMVHVVHASSVAYFTAGCVLAQHEVNLKYRHTSNLPQGRCLWLREQISEGQDIAVSVDSDTAFDPMEAIAVIEDFAIHCIAAQNVAIGIAPVFRSHKGTVALNLYTGHGKMLAVDECDSGHRRLWAGGFGMAVFNLAWFRRHWEKPFPESFGAPEESIDQGEDIQFCRSVARRNGAITTLWIPTKHYDSSSNRVIGGALTYKDGKLVIT